MFAFEQTWEILPQNLGQESPWECLIEPGADDEGVQRRIENPFILLKLVQFLLGEHKPAPDISLTT